MQPNAAKMPCERHPNVAVSAQCLQCGQPICRDCVAEFGYFCGDACRTRAKASINPEEQRAREAEEADYAATARKAKGIVLAVAGGIVLLIALGVVKSLLFSPGCLAWKWQFPAGVQSVEIVGRSAETVSVLAGDTLYRLSAVGGRERGRVKLAWQPDGDPQLHLTADGGLIGVDGRYVCRQDAAGKLLYTYDMGQRGDDLRFAADLSSLWCLCSPDYNEETGTAPPRKLICVDLATGRERWHGEASPDMVAADVLLADARLFLYERKPFDPNAEVQPAGGNVVALDALTGRRLWVLRLSEDPTWGPRAAGGLLLMHYKGKFRAVAADGAEAWSVAIPASEDPGHTVGAGLVFLEGEKGSHVFDLATGRRLWSLGVLPDGQTLLDDGGRVILTGAAPMGGAGSPLPPGFNQAEDVVKDMGSGGLMKRFMRQQVLVAVDRASGKELWRAANVPGQLLADGSRLIEVNDTNLTSTIQMMTGGRGATVLRQFATKDGAKVFRRQLDLDLDPYGIVGKRLIGVARTRTEQIGILGAAQGEKPPPGNRAETVGVVGIRIK